MASDLPIVLLNAIAKCFEPNPETLSRVIYYLCLEAAKGLAEPFIRALEAVRNIPSAFKMVAEKFAEDTKTAETDPQYQQFMYDYYNYVLKENPDQKPGFGQRFDWAVPYGNIYVVTVHNFMRALSKMSPESYSALSHAVQTIGGKNVVARCVGNSLDMIRVAKPLVRVALVAGQLAYDIYVNIKRWWNGEITGERCLKNIIDNSASIFAGIAGGIGGEMIGTAAGAALGPLGIAIGGVVGAIAGGAGAAYGAKVLSDRLTQWLFDIPQSEALENAFNFLDLEAKASNSDINARYRHLALRYHPDKRGDPEKWHRLQFSMLVIRAAKGEP